jgi:hypothetical protein
MPGTRPSCPGRQESPARPPVRDSSCSVGHVNGRIGDVGRSGPVAAVPGDRRSLCGSTWCGTLSAAPGIRHARCGGRRSEASAPGRVLRYTGLPSRSALVAPPLRLAALRWREVCVALGRSRPPLGVSTAFLVAVTHFFGTLFPRVPPLRMCPSRSSGGTFSRTARPPVRDSSCSVGHVNGRIGDVGRSGPVVAAVPGDRRSLCGSTWCGTLSAAPGIRHARCGGTPSTTSGWPRSTRSSWRDAAAGGGSGDRPR